MCVLIHMYSYYTYCQNNVYIVMGIAINYWYNTQYLNGATNFAEVKYVAKATML